jgi:class 3 adenylate cyclase
LTAAETSAAPSASTGTTLHDAAERRQLTVMFCDLVGSTALSVRFDPEELREEIRAYQNAVSGVVARYDGFVAKFMGDGVLAYFGYPRAHEDDAERAVRAGLEIAAAVRSLETRGTERLAVRIGIATGLVVVGDLVGEGSAQEQAVVGETPNLACRLSRNPGRSSSPGPPAAWSATCSGCATSAGKRSRASPSRSRPS